MSSIDPEIEVIPDDEVKIFRIQPLDFGPEIEDLREKLRSESTEGFETEINNLIDSVFSLGSSDETQTVGHIDVFLPWPYSDEDPPQSAIPIEKDVLALDVILTTDESRAPCITRRYDLRVLIENSLDDSDGSREEIENIQLELRKLADSLEFRRLEAPLRNELSDDAYVEFEKKIESGEIDLPEAGDRVLPTVRYVGTMMRRIKREERLKKAQ